MTSDAKPLSCAPDTVKQCCANLYESDLAKLLLGDSFHPGGTRLTERLGRLMQLSPESRVLDVAAGNGTSAVFLAERFGCEVVGIDYGQQNVQEANQQSKDKGLEGRVCFEQADAERLPFPDASFDGIVCECAFCTFPNKPAAAQEFARVLRVGGQVGLSDLTRGAVLPEELNSLLSWITCIADAQPAERYAGFLSAAGLTVQQTEPHDEALIEMVNQVRMKLLGAEIMVGLKKLDLPAVDFRAAKETAKLALLAIQNGALGYTILTATKPSA